MDESCLFCKIVAGKLPSTKIYEDDDIYAFLDIQPINYGHTLVVPKEHHVDIFDLPDAMVSKLALISKKIAYALRDGLETRDVNIYMNNGPHSGQVIFHSHTHVIPRYKDDGRDVWHSRKKYTEAEAQEIAEKIKKSL